MGQNKRLVIGPVALTAVYTTNVAGPAATGASAVGYTATASYLLLQRVLVANKTGTAATFRLYVGGTGGNVAGTEIAYDRSVAANSEVALDFPGGLRIDGSSFLVGGASAGVTLTLTAVGEVGLV